IANPFCYSADNEHADIKAEITKRHDEAAKRLQDWIAQVSIAAENRGYPEGAEYMAKLARDAGFQQVSVIATDGKPGVFATLDAGAAKTVGLDFMSDVNGLGRRGKHGGSTSRGSARLSSVGARPIRRGRKQHSSRHCTRSAVRVGIH